MIRVLQSILRMHVVDVFALHVAAEFPDRPRPMNRIAIVGIGKIARDQHIPHIAANGAFDLVAGVTRHDAPDGIPVFPTIGAMMAAMPTIQAVSICTPPRGRLALVREAFDHRLDVMLEKPPAATLSEAESFAALAGATDRVIFATWHSREAAAVAPAKAWLVGKTIRRTVVKWQEDVRVWHPGQQWIWEPGIGVFDPGINALSVITALLPGPLLLDEAELRFPANKAAPIAADLTLTDGGGASVEVAFDFDRRGPQHWDITIDTDDGSLHLSHGASRMTIDGVAVDVGDEPEYARLYRRFAHLLATRTSDIDLSPFRIVADAFLLGRHREVAPFAD